MPDFFRERLERDLVREAAADGHVDIARLLASWSSDRSWAAAALRVPPAQRRQILAELGRETFDRDWGQYAVQLRFNTRDLEFLWPGEQRQTLLRRHTELLFAAVADQVGFCDRDETRQILDDVVVSGTDHLRDSQAAGRGTMIVSVRQSHPGFAFKHSCMAGLSCYAIYHEDGETRANFPALLQGISDRVELLNASPGSVRRILAALRQNQCVTFYNDFVFPESLGVPTGLFGKRVLISRSAVAIALRARATVVPATIARQYPPGRGHVSVEFYKPLPLEDLDGRCPEDVLQAGLRFGIATECLIRRYPAQWILWNTLEHRWRQADNSITTPRE
jgi:lauroyl/myristoyl acyltransferase